MVGVGAGGKGRAKGRGGGGREVRREVSGPLLGIERGQGSARLLLEELESLGILLGERREPPSGPLPTAVSPCGVASCAPSSALYKPVGRCGAGLLSRLFSTDLSPGHLVHLGGSTTGRLDLGFDCVVSDEALDGRSHRINISPPMMALI